MQIYDIDLNPKEVCCFTGHRPNRLPWGDNEADSRCIALKEQLTASLKTAYQKGYRHFFCGMAQGADFYFCETALALAQELEGMEVWAIIPCVTQSQHWDDKDRARYLTLLEGCHHQITLQAHYTKDCMHRRNRFMVEHSSLLIAAYDGNPVGGALYTMAYAMKSGIEVEILEINP